MAELPTISQYVYSVSSPAGIMRTLGDFEPERDIYGNVRFRAGNNAVVFKITKDGIPMMLKCYFKYPRNLSHIYSYLHGTGDELLHHAELLSREIFVSGHLGESGYFDAVISEWAEGNTLETGIKRSGTEYGQAGFKKLSEAFDKMSLELLGREWAHGDLKPENIIVWEDGRMSLIDYDAMYIPETGHETAFEIGTPGYQHPYRDERMYGKHMDDYSIALISVSLKALECRPELYKKYHRSGIIIMHPEEIIKGRSVAYGEVLGTLAQAGLHYHYALAKKLDTPDPSMEGMNRILGRINGLHPGISYDGGTTPVLFGRDNSWGYKTLSGEVLVEPIYDEGTEFREGYAVVKLHGTFQVIDTKGSVTIDGKGYDVIKPFSEGRAAAGKGGKWTFIDINGNPVCGFCFEAAGSVHGNRAPVLVSGRWGYTDGNGKIAIAPQYEFAAGFRNGKATVCKDGETFEIDIHGDIIM